MTSLFYCCVFVASLICTAVYIYIWHRRFDVNFTLIFIFVPVACMGYLLQSTSGNVEEWILSSKIVYLGGTYLQLFIMLSIFNFCQIEINRKIRVLLFTFATLLYASVLSIGYTDLFYKNVSLDVEDGKLVFLKSYGWMHTVFYVYIIILFIAGISAIIYSWLRKSQVPRTIIALLVIPDCFSVFCFFIVRRLINVVEIVPLVYVLALIMFIIIANRANLYNVSDTAVDSLMRERAIGYISFDYRYRYLGSNVIARNLVPELSKLGVDDILGYKPGERKIRLFLDSFKENPKKNVFEYAVPDPDSDGEDENIYNVNINYLYEGSRKRGYIVTFTDDTANRRYIRLMNNYNEKLKDEVGEKTRSIIAMHDNLIMSLAMMVESRDNSTGGHIKRTSEGVRILIEEIKKEGDKVLSDEFCRDVIKAAPMHDLGKIAVDDAVLRKEGRFDDDEYAKMKKHAAEGARVIHEILLNTDDESFKTVAENVAHYHHERWDGSGYPEGLSGEDIPFEARIMAIADVYDALVSKRVYKDAFSFEKADRIIWKAWEHSLIPVLRRRMKMQGRVLKSIIQSSRNRRAGQRTVPLTAKERCDKIPL